LFYLYFVIVTREEAGQSLAKISHFGGVGCGPWKQALLLVVRLLPSRKVAFLKTPLWNPRRKFGLEWCCCIKKLSGLACYCPFPL